MSSNGDDFFLRMCREAQREMASGKDSWKDVETNTLILACFGMVYNHLSHKVMRPLWLFSTSVLLAVVGYLVNLVFNALSG